MANLPFEIFYEIASYLDHHDLKVFARTCRLLHDVAIPQLYRQVIFTYNAYCIFIEPLRRGQKDYIPELAHGCPTKHAKHVRHVMIAIPPGGLISAGPSPNEIQHCLKLLLEPFTEVEVFQLESREHKTRWDDLLRIAVPALAMLPKVRTVAISTSNDTLMVGHCDIDDQNLMLLRTIVPRIHTLSISYDSCRYSGSRGGTVSSDPRDIKVFMDFANLFGGPDSSVRKLSLVGVWVDIEYPVSEGSPVAASQKLLSFPNLQSLILDGHSLYHCKNGIFTAESMRSVRQIWLTVSPARLPRLSIMEWYNILARFSEVEEINLCVQRGSRGSFVLPDRNELRAIQALSQKLRELKHVSWRRRWSTWERDVRRMPLHVNLPVAYDLRYVIVRTASGLSSVVLEDSFENADLYDGIPYELQPSDLDEGVLIPQERD